MRYDVQSKGIREEVKRVIGSPSAHSTEETANYSGGKGHTLYEYKELLRGQESQLVQCLKLKYRVKPYALIGHVRFE